MPVEVVERLEFTEAGGLHTTGDEPVIADEQLILEHEFQELGVSEVIAGRFLKSNVERAGQC